MISSRRRSLSLVFALTLSTVVTGCASWGFQPAQPPPIAVDDVVDVRPILDPRMLKLINTFATLHHKNMVRSILRDGFVEEQGTTVGLMGFNQGPNGVIELRNGDQIDYQLSEHWGRPALLLYMPDGTQPMVVVPEPEDDEWDRSHC